MRFTKQKLRQIIREEISKIQESRVYDAISADMDLVMKRLTLEEVIDIVKPYLEVMDLYKIVTDMPEVEMIEIYDELRNKADGNIS